MVAKTVPPPASDRKPEHPKQAFYMEHPVSDSDSSASHPRPGSTWYGILGAFALALAVGGVGGTIFLCLDLPLPFILGPMVFCLVAAVMRLPVSTPGIARPPMSAVIGVMLGASYTPEMLSAIGNWVVPALGLVAFMVFAAAVCIAYFVWVVRLDTKTAFFSGMPGGLMEMVLLGEQYRADTRVIALVHSARILIVVFTLPFLIEALSHVEIDTVAATSAGREGFYPWDYLWLAATALAGIALGHVARLPAKHLLGPMIVSAVLHSTGITDFATPVEVVIAAQIVIGASIGCRFAGISPSEILRILALSLGSVAILLTITVLFALAVASITPYGFTDLLLAYSPGGLAEMGLIALSLNIEVAFVTTLHIFRVLLVAMGAPIIGRFILFRS